MIKIVTLSCVYSCKYDVENISKVYFVILISFLYPTYEEEIENFRNNFHYKNAHHLIWIIIYIEII